MLKVWGSYVAGCFNFVNLQLYSNIGAFAKLEIQINKEF